MALGIPDITKAEKVPKGNYEAWTFNIQRHTAKRAGDHFDFRLSPPGSGKAYSWASRNPLPNPGGKIMLVEQPTHESSYLGFSGKIPKGEYGAGDVTSILLDKVEVLESSPDRITFNIYSGNDVQRFILKRTSGSGKGAQWLLYNHSVTTDSKVNALIPDYKPGYKEVPYKDVSITRKTEILAPKLDGAHNTILLRPDKRIDVYSYRLRKNRPTRIDHSFKTDLYKQRAPKALGTTVVRAELYLPKAISPLAETGTSETVSGILNSNTWKAREKLRTLNAKLKPIIFDVVRYKGKLVEDAPYARKLEILKEVAEAIPELSLPELAITPKDKLKLLDKIKSGKHSETDEGVVVYDLLKSKPIKAKIKSDIDLLITGVFPAAPGSKYEHNSIGGFTAVAEGGGTNAVPIRVGSGLSDELRRAAYLNPNAFIGNWIKVEGGRMYTSGKIRTPIFKGFRTDKYRNI